MRLSEFITANLDPILDDWVEFARHQQPAAAGMDERALLDHGKLILQEIAADMNRPQDDDRATGEIRRPQRHVHRPRRMFPRAAMPASASGRDLPWSRWSRNIGHCAPRSCACGVPSAPTVRVEDLEDVIRFNEAVDQAIAESLTVFIVEVDRTRDLFLGCSGTICAGR